MLLGLGGILMAVLPSPSHMAIVSEWVAANGPEKVAVPSWTVCVTWASTLLLVGISGSVYPQAIAGLAVAFALPLTSVSRPFGLHDGAIGFAVNLLVCVALSWIWAHRGSEAPRREAV